MWRILMILSLLLVISPVQAHPARTSAVLLDMGDRGIAMEAHIPLHQLRMTLPERPISIPDTGTLKPETYSYLENYLQEHITLSIEGKTITPAVINQLLITPIDDIPHLQANLSFVTGTLAADTVMLNYDVILHRVVSHKIYVSIRRDFRQAIFPFRPQPIDILRYQKSHLVIKRESASIWRGFVGMFQYGIEYMAVGLDHVLLLISLLLPTVLIAKSGRWAASAKSLQAIRSMIKVVAAFAVGYSLTLLLGTFGLVIVPSQAVEITVVLSVLISVLIAAVNIIKPLLPHHSAWLAGGLGLIHGLAFSDTLVTLGFEAKTTLIALLGFNLGIEVTQLVIVLALLPCLLILSQWQGLYRVIRLIIAVLIISAALCWIAERAFTWQTPLSAYPYLVPQHALTGYSILLIASLLLFAVHCFQGYRTKRLAK